MPHGCPTGPEPIPGQDRPYPTKADPQKRLEARQPGKFPEIPKNDHVARYGTGTHPCQGPVLYHKKGFPLETVRGEINGDDSTNALSMNVPTDLSSFYETIVAIEVNIPSLLYFF